MLSSETDLAYAAGIIDGEGCIGVYGYVRPSIALGKRYSLTVRVSMVDSEPPTFLHETFGGYLGHLHCPSRQKNNQRAQYYWCIAAQKARQFLIVVLPYLRARRKQAEVAIEFQTAQQRGIWRDKMKAIEQLERGRMYSNQLKVLKGKEVGENA